MLESNKNMASHASSKSYLIGQIHDIQKELCESQESSQAVLDIALGRCNAKDEEIAELKAKLARVEQNYKDLFASAQDLSSACRQPAT